MIEYLCYQRLNSEMENNKTTSSAEENERRFRGNWAPLIRDPAKYAYDLSSRTLALERAVAAHDLEHETEDTLINFEAHNQQKQQQQNVEQYCKDDDSQTTQATSSSKIYNENSNSSDAALLEDAQIAQKRVNDLKAKHPEMCLDELCEILISTKCKQGALVGLCSGAPSLLVPGWGSLAGILLGSVADVTLTTKLEVDLALEIACLYGLYDVYCTGAIARRTYLLHVAGLEGLDEDVKDEDEKATREAGERLAVRATEEVGKRSLLRFVPVIGTSVAAGTNAVGIYVIGRRAQQIVKGNPVGKWRESVNNYVVPADISRAITLQMSRAPSALTIRVAEMTTRLGASARRIMVSATSSASTTFTYHTSGGGGSYKT